MIDSPMDLSRVHEKMLMGRYSSLSGFCRDMRLIFNNSRMYNTNKRSRVSSVKTAVSVALYIERSEGCKIVDSVS